MYDALPSLLVSRSSKGAAILFYHIYTHISLNLRYFLEVILSCHCLYYRGLSTTILIAYKRVNHLIHSNSMYIILVVSVAHMQVIY